MAKNAEERSLSEIIAGLEEVFPDMPPEKLLEIAEAALDEDAGAGDGGDEDESSRRLARRPTDDDDEGEGRRGGRRNRDSDGGRAENSRLTSAEREVCANLGTGTAAFSAFKSKRDKNVSIHAGIESNAARLPIVDAARRVGSILQIDPGAILRRGSELAARGGF